MKAKTRFLKMYYKLPDQAKRILIYMDYIKRIPEPYAMSVLAQEIRHDTELGKRILAELGYEEELKWT